ncbi:MAG: ATP-binding cassette domain-containing protein [Thermodesulfobacteriota bacterium]|nr:ATP-binding cassette domain-containing protein [Thermodesulfobacteriota bacterium]
MLKIEGLKVKIAGKDILNNINMEIKAGESHALFGPNGSGKTTLLMTIMGFSGYNVVEGKIFFKKREITRIPMNERANLGIGLSFQRPPNIRGINMRQMIEICNKGKGNIEVMARELNLYEFLDREINFGFSGGEIKRSELFQIMAQNPDLILLDEPESGVDLENIYLIGGVIGKLLKRNLESHELKSHKEIKRERIPAGLIITHTGYILDYVDVDQGHVLFNGELCCTGNPREIFKCIKEFGYKECLRCSF